VRKTTSVKDEALVTDAQYGNEKESTEFYRE
jgi:hypothetical protein